MKEELYQQTHNHLKHRVKKKFEHYSDFGSKKE